MAQEMKAVRVAHTKHFVTGFPLNALANAAPECADRDSNLRRTAIPI